MLKVFKNRHPSHYQLLYSNREGVIDAERSSDTCSKISGAEILHRLIITCVDTKYFRYTDQTRKFILQQKN